MTATNLAAGTALLAGRHVPTAQRIELVSAAELAAAREENIALIGIIDQHEALLRDAAALMLDYANAMDDEHGLATTSLITLAQRITSVVGEMA